MQWIHVGVSLLVTLIPVMGQEKGSCGLHYGGLSSSSSSDSYSSSSDEGPPEGPPCPPGAPLVMISTNPAFLQRLDTSTLLPCGPVVGSFPIPFGVVTAATYDPFLNRLYMIHLERKRRGTRRPSGNRGPWHLHWYDFVNPCLQNPPNAPRKLHQSDVYSLYFHIPTKELYAVLNGNEGNQIVRMNVDTGDRTVVPVLRQEALRLRSPSILIPVPAGVIRLGLNFDERLANLITFHSNGSLSGGPQYNVFDRTIYVVSAMYDVTTNRLIVMEVSRLYAVDYVWPPPTGGWQILDSGPPISRSSGLVNAISFYDRFRIRCIHPGQTQVQVPPSTAVELTFSDVPTPRMESVFYANGVAMDFSNSTVDGNVLTIQPPVGGWKSPALLSFPPNTFQNPFGEGAPLEESNMTFTVDGAPRSTDPIAAVGTGECTSTEMQGVILAACDVESFVNKFSQQQVEADVNCGSFVFTLTINELPSSSVASATTALTASLASPALTSTLTGGGTVISGTVTAMGTEALLARDFIVDNGEGPVATGLDVTITFTTNTASTIAIPMGGSLRVAYPFDWVLSNTVPSALTMDMTVDGMPVITGQVASNVDTTGNFFDFPLTGLTSNVGSDAVVVLTLHGSGGQTTTPGTCLNFNGWTWSVVASNAGTVYNFILQNPPTDKCLSYRAIVFGDPHFDSFSGGTYDILGTPGLIYNIITDKHFQWNSRFVFPGNKLTQSYIGESGFRIGEDQVVVRPDGTAQVNGVPMLPNSKVVLQADQLWFIKMTRTHILLRVPGFRIALKYEAEAHHKPVPHFDFTVELVNEEQTGVAHGLLGQTAQFKSPVVPKPRWNKQGLGVIEGSVSDYVVSALLATKFKFNRFGRLTSSS